MGDATELQPAPKARKPLRKRKSRKPKASPGSDAGRPRLTWSLGSSITPEDLCQGPCVTDEDIYAPIEESRQRGKADAAWSEVAHVLQKEVETSGILLADRSDAAADIRLLQQRLASSQPMVADAEAFEAARLDFSRLEGKTLEPTWVRMVLAARLTIMAQRNRPTTDAGSAEKSAALDFIYDHAGEWNGLAEERTGHTIFKALEVMTTPIVTINDQPAMYAGELHELARQVEMRELLNKILTLGFPLFLMGSIAKHLPIFGWLIQLSMDPGTTLENAWDTITDPGQILEDMEKAKEEHGWNFLNPAYWAMVNFYEADRAFEKWRETGDPRYALEGMDRFGQGVGNAIDTVGVATGVTAVSPRRVVVDAPRKVDDAVQRGASAGRASRRAKAATQTRRTAMDELAKKLARVSANPFLDPEVIAQAVVVAYELAKEGITTFDAFIKKLRADRAFKKVDFDALSADELAALRGAFADGAAKVAKEAADQAEAKLRKLEDKVRARETPKRRELDEAKELAERACEADLGKKPTKHDFANWMQKKGYSQRLNDVERGKARLQEIEDVGGGAEHTSGARGSTVDPHQAGRSRKAGQEERAIDRRLKDLEEKDE